MYIITYYRLVSCANIYLHIDNDIIYIFSKWSVLQLPLRRVGTQINETFQDKRGMQP